jgi:predicted TIM-barrel fold metal-dependent hydrolase
MGVLLSRGPDAVPGNGRCDLAPGTYGKLSIQTSAKVTLQGGAYVFCEVAVSQSAEVIADATTTIDVAGDVRRLLEVYRLGAIKLHPPHMEMAANAYRTDCPSLADVYRAAGEAKRPVLIHTGTSVFPGARNVYADPMPCDDVAVDFPETRIVLCHAGRPLWYQTAFFLVRRHPNVWMDVSSIPPKKLLEVLPRISEVADRVLWGTDWPSKGVVSMRQNAEDFLALPLPEAVQRKILFDNAATLFPL